MNVQLQTVFAAPLNHERATALLMHLEHLRLVGPGCRHAGICAAVRTTTHTWDNMPDETLRGLFRRLGLDQYYPVRLPGWADSDAAHAFSSADLWDSGTAYGRARYAVLGRLIALLRDDLGI